MKTFIITIIAILLSVAISYAAPLNETITVPASGEIFKSFQTSLGKQYLLTFEGTYSMWGQSKTPGNGVDAIWYYDIPEFGNIILDNLVANLLKDPIYVGVDRDISIPAAPPSFGGAKLNLANFTGLRFNDVPLSEQPIDKLNHRYQATIKGTGEPFKFQIIDSVFDFTLEKIIPRYDDNSGAITITIQEITSEGGDDEINICGIAVTESDGNNHQIQLRASALQADSNEVSGTKNNIYDISQIGIIIDGKFICPDSLVCDEYRAIPVAFGIVLDKSASMELPISIDRLETSRMQAAVDAINIVFDNMNTSASKMDSAFVVSFADSAELECDWTSNNEQLKNSLQNLIPASGTALYEGIFLGLEKLAMHQHQQKALIVLTDGVNTHGSVNYEQLIKTIEAKYFQIPIYIIGLSLDDSKPLLNALDTMKRITAASSEGNFFSINEKDELNEVYRKLSEHVSTDECCSIYFSANFNCETSNEHKATLLFSTMKSGLLAKDIIFKCKEEKKITSIEQSHSSKQNNDVSAEPNPFSETSALKIIAKSSSYSKIDIVDLTGRVVLNIYNGFINPGENIFEINRKNLPNAMYFVRSFFDGKVISTPIIINN